MPSLWPEPLGLSGLEALQLGTPVVAFATGGIPEWLEDGVDGYLAPADPPTAEGLASAIVKALNDRLLRGRVQERGRSLACGTLDKHLEALLPILRGAARNELVECTVSAPDLVSCR
jgi:glycosyltransferase involved in cell wall biosynthesis